MKKTTTITLVAATIGTIWMGISCSPVNFTQQTGACSVSQPCLNSSGTEAQVTQPFAFNYSNAVDILIVDDNSLSMDPEQQAMASAFNSFTTSLSSLGLDWQMGITTTDVCNHTDDYLCYYFQNDPTDGAANPGYNFFMQNFGAQGRLINQFGNYNPGYGSFILTPNTPSATFYNTIQRGNEIGSGDERAVYALNEAVDQANGANAGLFRSNANLAVVILSDEDERSWGDIVGDNNNPNRNYCDVNNLSSCPDYAAFEQYDYPQTFLDKVNATWNNSKKLQVNAITIVPGDTNCLNIQQNQPGATAHFGYTYQQLANMTHGSTNSICNEGPGQFTSMLQGIASNISQMTLSKVITLANPADSQPTVTFKPPQNISWQWNSNAPNIVTLNTLPSSGTVVSVTYTYKTGN